VVTLKSAASDPLSACHFCRIHQ